MESKLRKIILNLHSKGYLPSSELLEFFFHEKVELNEINNIISLSKTLQLDGKMPTLDYIKLNILKKQESNVNWYEIDRTRVLLEKNKNDKIYSIILKNFIEENEIEKYTSFLKKIKISFNNNTYNKQENVNFQEKTEKVENKIIDNNNKNNKETNKKIDEKKILINTERMFEKIKTNSSIISKFNNIINGDLKERENKNEINDEEEKNKGINKIMANYSTNEKRWVENELKIIKSYKSQPKKVELADFLSFFRNKYKLIKKELENRIDVNNNLVSINNLTGNNTETIIAMIRELNYKEKKIDLIVEDLSGTIKVVVDLTKDPTLKEEALKLVHDDVIAIQGRLKGNIFYAEKIIYPDIPNHQQNWLENYGINEDIYLLALSDIHVGSKLFLKNKFEKLIRWLNGENNKLHKQIGYIVISGDLIDGIGVYPEQIEELEVYSAIEQYKKFAELLERIPSEINIIISPGNHDALRLAEPQPALNGEICEEIKEKNNIYLVSNPSYILLKEKIKTLIYHGYSYDYFINNVDHLRNKLSYEEIHKLMSLLLQKRYLVPTYDAAPIYPEKEDFLFIKEVPNILISGHVHKSSVGSYKGVKLLSSSCWQDKTPFQEKVGHEPDPGKVPLINLKDGKVRLLQF